MILHLRSIAKLLGTLLTFVGIAMAVPLLYAALAGENDIVLAFLMPSAFAVAVGVSLSITYRAESSWITLKDSLLLTF